MAALGEILRRFRFHGVPGAPTAAGVPADRTAGLEGELAPVFAALEDPQRHAVALLTEATHSAEQRRAAARDEARRLVVEAHSGAVAARAEAAAARLALADAECSAMRAAGHAEAQRVRLRAAERTDALVELVVLHVLDLVQAEERRS